MNISGGTKKGGTRGGTRIGIGLLLLTPTLASAPPARAQEVFAGVCDMTLGVTYTPGLKLVPAPLSPTEVAVDGGGTCTTLDGTAVGTLHAGGTTTLGTFGCAGGIVVGRGTFDIDDEEYPASREGRAVITLTGAVATVTVEADDLSVTATGAFLQPLPTLTTCTVGNGLETTTWEGTLAFVATTVAPPGGQEGQRGAQVSPLSTEQ